MEAGREDVVRAEKGFPELARRLRYMPYEAPPRVGEPGELRELKLGVDMKTLVATFGLSLALASGALAQGKPENPANGRDSTGKAISSTHYAEAMARLPEGVAEKIAAARDAAKAAKADVDAMKAQGKTAEEIAAMIAEKRAAALMNLQKALDALNGLPDNAKERVSKAKEVISKRIEERKNETP
jgi:hypothetical protein